MDTKLIRKKNGMISESVSYCPSPAYVQSRESGAVKIIRFSACLCGKVDKNRSLCYSAFVKYDVSKYRKSIFSADKI